MKWLKWIWRWIWAIPLTGVLVFLTYGLFLAEAGRFVSTPSDTPERADLVADLGGGPASRTQKSGELLKQGFANRIFLTGPIDTRKADLLKLGWGSDQVLEDGKSRHSWDEAVNTLYLMKANGWKKVLVVSDPEHMRRLSWTWGHVFRDSGMSFRLIPADTLGWEPDHWWRSSASKAYVDLEIEKLIYYVLRYNLDRPDMSVELPMPAVKKAP